MKNKKLSIKLLRELELTIKDMEYLALDLPNLGVNSFIEAQEINLQDITAKSIDCSKQIHKLIHLLNTYM